MMESRNFLNFFRDSKYFRFFNDDRKVKNNDLELVCASILNSEEKSSSKITTIYKVESIEDIFDYFDSLKISSLITVDDKVFLFKLKIKKDFHALNTTELYNLAKKICICSVVIFLSAENGKRFFLYWKSNKIQHFLMFKTYKRAEFMHQLRVFEFIATFLVDSLKRGHLGLHSQVPIRTESNSYELHLLADHRNYNLLLIAAEIGDSFMVNFMLDGGFSTEARDTNAQTLAWKRRHFEVLFELLKSNLTFPDSFNIEECPDNIKSFYQVSFNLYEAMILKNTAKVCEIMSKYPKMKHFYNLENESVLAFALRNKLFDMFRLLISNNIIRFGPHELFSEIKESMSQADKEKLREIHYEKSKLLPDNHMHILLLNSRLGHNTTDTEKKFQVIQKAFEVLNENPFIRVILMIVAASRNFRIIFDFNCDSVEVIDPTANETTRGIFYSTGRIYVAVKKLLDENAKFDALGTLAHELCHYAVNVVFKNFAKPYDSHDSQAKDEFEEIFNDCKENFGKEEIIDFVHQCYPDYMQHAELVVRPAHLIMLYWNDLQKFEKVRNDFTKLFNDFENRIIPNMKKALPNIEKKAEHEVQTKNRKIRNLKMISIVGGLLSIIIIISGFFITRSIFYEPNFKFSGLNNLDKLKVQNAPIDYKNIKLKFHELFSNSSKAYEKLSSDHISQMLHNNKPLNISGSSADYLNGFINFNWKNLTEKLKDKVLISNFLFQNEFLNFKILKSSILESLNSQQIIDILDNKTIKIPQSIEIGSKLYIERNMMFESIHEIYFAYLNHVGYTTSLPCNYTLYENETFEEFYYKYLNQSIIKQIEKIIHIRDSPEYIKCFETELIGNLEEQPFVQISFDEILEVANKTKIFILSSKAGTGKTTTFQQLTLRIKKNHPTFWVSYIDLRDLRNLDKIVDSLEDFQKLFEKIFNFETADEFQKAIFNDLFMTGKTILLWIGLEDVFPDYGKETLNIFKIIQTETRNIQLISTRPSYSGVLMQKFRTKSYTFTPFSTKEQEKFLRKVFISQNLNNETQVATYLEKVHKIVKSGNLKDESMTPLLLRMIAELISNDKELFETENLYEIYEKFINTKIKEWSKTEFRKKNSDLKNFSLKKFYQQCAIKTIPESFALSFNSKHLQIMKHKTSKDLNIDISRMEILYINGPKSIKFTHDSFANFFFAQYLIENIYNLNIHDNASIQELDYRLRVFCSIFEYPEVSNFIASYLQSKAAKSTEKFHPKLSYLFKTKFRRIFFNYLKLEITNFDIFPFLIKFFQNDHELLIDLLQINQSKTFYTELFNYGNLAFSAFFNYDMDLDQIKNIVKTHLNDLEFKKFLIGNNQKGIVLFSSYCFYKGQDGDSDDDLRFLLINQKYKLGKKLLKSKKPDYVFTTIANNLTKEELKELLTSKALLYPIQLRDDDVYIFDEKMWKRVEENFSIEEQKRWLNDMIQVASFSENQNFTKKFFLKIDQIFSNLEINKLFRDRQILQISASYSINTFNYLWNFYVNHSTKIEQIFILKQQVEIECTGDFDPYGDCYLFPSLNILLSSLLDPDFFDIEDVKNIYFAYFNTTEIQNMILNSDNFLTYSFIHHTFGACKSLLFVLKSFFIRNQNLLTDFYTYTRDLLPVLPNYENYEEKYELLSQALDDLTY